MVSKNPFEVVQKIAKKHGITQGDIFSKKRDKHLVDARAEIVCILRDDPFNLSYPYIGTILHRDHTTVISLYKRNRVAVDK